MSEGDDHKPRLEAVSLVMPIAMYLGTQANREPEPPTYGPRRVDATGLPPRP